MIKENKIFLIGDFMIINHKINFISKIFPIIFIHDNNKNTYDLTSHNLINLSNFTITSILITISINEAISSYRVSGIKQISQNSINIKEHDIKYIKKTFTNIDSKIYTQIKNKQSHKADFIPVQPKCISTHEQLIKYVTPRITKDIDNTIVIEEKIDGVRCLAHITYNLNETNTIILMTRKNKKIVSQSFLIKQLEILTENIKSDIVFYGELMYEDNYASTVAGIVNSITERQEKLTYFIFDMIFLSSPELPFIERKYHLNQLFLDNKRSNLITNIHVHKSHFIHDINNVEKIINKLQEKNREGIIIRLTYNPYFYCIKSIDTATIHKYKFFNERMFMCTGVSCDKEERIMYRFKTVNIDGNEYYFNCKPKETDNNRRELYKKFINETYNPIGNTFSIRYSNINQHGIPMHSMVICDKIT